jgi:hypothetical protein
MKEEIFENEVVDETIADALLDSSSNDTNEDDLYYFARVSNHYLCLVKSAPSSMTSWHNMRYLIIADSGAKFHMFKEPEFFLSIKPASGSVTLGDG